MTPHIGASTVEAQIRIAETIAVQVPKALRGEVVDFPVNMPAVQVLDSPVVKSYTTLAERLGLFAAQYIGFAPDRLKIHYRGGLAKYDPSLLRLCFLIRFFERFLEAVALKNITPVFPIRENPTNIIFIFRIDMDTTLRPAMTTFCAVTSRILVGFQCSWARCKLEIHAVPTRPRTLQSDQYS